MSAWTLVSFGALALPPNVTPAIVQGEIAKRLIGTWRLVDITNDKGEQIRAPKPTGLLMYDSSGNMAVQIQPDWERPAAIDGYTAYFGTYSVHEQTAIVTDQRAGNINPGDMGDFVRQVEFREPNWLILRTRGTNNQIVWERAK